MDAQPGLVADVGRLSVSFGLTGGGGGVVPREVRRYQTAEHPAFVSALMHYLRDLKLEQQHLRSALAVAGAVRGDLINLTGSHWYISLTGVEAVLRAKPRALNECSAAALGLTTLEQSAFKLLPGTTTARRIETGGNYLLVSPGMGLGVAGLITDHDRLVPVQSEAAHMSFAPVTEAEAKVADYLTRRGVTLTNEALISSGGLLAMYAALSGASSLMDRVDQVIGRAAHDAAALAAIECFIGALGRLIGDLSLAFGAWDGVFLSGALAQSLHRYLQQPLLRERMIAKTPMRRQLTQVPVSLVSAEGLELVGAAVSLHG